MVHRRIDYFGSIKLPGRTRTSSDCSCQSTAPHRWSAHIGMPRIRQTARHGMFKMRKWHPMISYWSQNIRIIFSFIEGTQQLTYNFVLCGLKKKSYPLAWCMIMLASPHLTITISLWCPAIIFGQCCKERLYLWEKNSSGSNATVLDFSRNQQWIKQSRNAGIRALSKIPGGIALAMGLESEHFDSLSIKHNFLSFLLILAARPENSKAMTFNSEAEQTQKRSWNEGTSLHRYTGVCL